MPSILLRITAVCCFLAVLLPALAFPAASGQSFGLYTIVIRGMGGLVLAAGGIACARSLEATLLRAGGNSAFKLLYLSSAGICGAGVAHGLSGVYPVNVMAAATIFTVMAIATGVMWVRFYHAATA